MALCGGDTPPSPPEKLGLMACVKQQYSNSTDKKKGFHPLRGLRRIFRRRRRKQIREEEHENNLCEEKSKSACQLLDETNNVVSSGISMSHDSVFCPSQSNEINIMLHNITNRCPKKETVNKSSLSTYSDGSLHSMESMEVDDTCGASSSTYFYDKADTIQLPTYNTTILSHSAAKHKIAIRPKRKHCTRRRSIKRALPMTLEVTEEPIIAVRQIRHLYKKPIIPKETSLKSASLPLNMNPSEMWKSCSEDFFKKPIVNQFSANSHNLLILNNLFNSNDECDTLPLDVKNIECVSSNESKKKLNPWSSSPITDSFLNIKNSMIIECNDDIPCSMSNDSNDILNSVKNELNISEADISGKKSEIFPVHYICESTEDIIDDKIDIDDDEVFEPNKESDICKTVNEQQLENNLEHEICQVSEIAEIQEVVRRDYNKINFNINNDNISNNSKSDGINCDRKLSLVELSSFFENKVEKVPSQKSIYTRKFSDDTKEFLNIKKIFEYTATTLNSPKRKSDSEEILDQIIPKFKENSISSSEDVNNKIFDNTSENTLQSSQSAQTFKQRCEPFIINSKTDKVFNEAIEIVNVKSKLSNEISRSCDDEPELLKVFARRSLKLRDNVDTVPIKSRDSDKENDEVYNDNKKKEYVSNVSSEKAILINYNMCRQRSKTLPELIPHKNNNDNIFNIQKLEQMKTEETNTKFKKIQQRKEEWEKRANQGK